MTAPDQSAGEAGTPHVYLLRDGQPVRVAVETGLDDDNYTEIVVGTLREGDRVIVSEKGSGSARSNGDVRPAMRFP